jgi:hypothetical protein
VGTYTKKPFLRAQQRNNEVVVRLDRGGGCVQQRQRVRAFGLRAALVNRINVYTGKENKNRMINDIKRPKI